MCILVLGMHRSGTSALTRAVSLLGAALPEHLLGANATNETGHWEPVRLVDLHDEMLAEADGRWDDWRPFDISKLPGDRVEHYRSEIARIIAAEYGDAPLIVLKDPRICRFVSLYTDILDAMGFDTHYLLMDRNPLEVAESLSARGGTPTAFSILLWLRHSLDAEKATRGQSRAFLSYDRLISDWRGELERVSDSLGITWPRSFDAAEPDITGHISADYRHYVENTDKLAAVLDEPGWTKDCYEALLTLAQDGDDAAALATLDRVRTEFDSVATVFGEAEFPELYPLRDLAHARAIEIERLTAELVPSRDLAHARALEIERLTAELVPLRELAAKKSERVKTLRRLGLRRALRAERLASELELETVEHSSQVRELRHSVVEASGELSRVRQERDRYAASLAEIYASRSWRLTGPLRGLTTRLRHVARPVRLARHQVRRLGGVGNASRIVVHQLRANGVAGTARKIRMRLFGYQEAVAADAQGETPIAKRYRAMVTDAAERLTPLTGSQASSMTGPLISILMPVYKVDPGLLAAAIESVAGQSYANWQFCIVDDASGSSRIDEMLSTYAAQDSRIKYRALPRNSGISAATNAALEMCEGDFFCLLDNDDLLTNDALAEIARAIEGGNLDWVYSDECKVDPQGRVLELQLKSDWDRFMLHNCMYTGHLSAYRTEMVRELGGFRSAYDFSQDYDLALRMSERTTRVGHIRKVLYGWRMIPSSAAAGGKPTARISNLAALQDAADRAGWDSKVVELPTANRLVWNGRDHGGMVGIIIPSDNLDHIAGTVRSIRGATSYKDYAIIVVCNSNIVGKAADMRELFDGVRFVAYDKPFNFSDKCNVGAEAAPDCDYLVFFNDDVRVIEPDWIEALLDYLRFDDVGAVAPKLLYENDTIQHAGMVTNVRGLVGTAFHALPGDTTTYFNLAQSVHQASTLSGACLAVKRETFEKVGGYDAKHFPIAHSDVDLCFKIRAAGFACVYTPHATLYHTGHLSIGKVESEKKRKTVDKADVDMLRYWPDYLAYDPFYTPEMRDILYHDFQERYDILAPAKSPAVGGERRAKNILLVFHDLTQSGAPRALFECAWHLRRAGHFVVAMSPSGGAYETRLQALGIPVVIDELAFGKHPSVRRFCSNFDAVIVNTVIGWPLVADIADHVPCYWYIHETGLIEVLLRQHPEIGGAFQLPRQVWVTGHRGLEFVKPYRNGARIMEIGLSSRPSVSPRPLSVSGTCRVCVIGSIEPRKGQDLAIAALDLMTAEERKLLDLHIFGRTLDPTFEKEVRLRADRRDNITFHGEVTPEQTLKEIEAADIVLVPSRDDPMPLVALDALARGRILVCGPAVGTFDYLEDGVSGVLAKSSAPGDLADALRRALTCRAKWREIGSQARKVYEATFSPEAFRERLFQNLEL